MACLPFSFCIYNWNGACNHDYSRLLLRAPKNSHRKSMKELKRPTAEMRANETKLFYLIRLCCNKLIIYFKYTFRVGNSDGIGTNPSIFCVHAECHTSNSLVVMFSNRFSKKNVFFIGIFCFCFLPLVAAAANKNNRPNNRSDFF